MGGLRAASWNLGLAHAARAAAPPVLRLHVTGLAGSPVFSEVSIPLIPISGSGVFVRGVSEAA